ncbi:hypothetical protein AX16_002695 [Volvariella volvacea WC 439]|nr:hypothetical protein AX16_002695 [Volvariella volvacea WC 439]
MFKNILPSKRIPSSDFTIVTPSPDSLPNGKENQPGVGMLPPVSPNAKGTRQVLAINKIQANEKKRTEKNNKDQTKPSDIPGTNQAFDKLLDDLQIPNTLRPKLAGMDATVKAAMLKSSQMIPNLKPINPAVANATSSTPRRALRKSRSTDSLSSSFSGKGQFDTPKTPQTAGLAPPQLSSHHLSVADSPSPHRHTRGTSFDIPRPGLKSQVDLHASVSTADLRSGVTGTQKNGKEKGSQIGGKANSPVHFVSLLLRASSTQLEIESVKKLRMMLRNEAASWTQEFLSHGGYNALLTRLNELLEVEWREEQHDDQMLHELLKCFKALTTSEVGCTALRSACPTPYIQLITLLYSDKKPGDVAPRQLIVELLLNLFDLYPFVVAPSPFTGRSARVLGPREASRSKDDTATSAVLPSPYKNFFSFIRSLLLTPAPPPAEATSVPVSPHEFIESLHRPRIYKTYLQELSDVCRDYFWVFCHPNNTIWLLHETDEARVEKPRAPGGMTGGVEFEAMTYFTTHLRFINAIAKSVESLGLPKDNELSAWRFHHDLFLSGFERIILISRKASTTFYPALHLELSRYINYAARAGYELPWTISRLIGLPPITLCRNPPPPPPVHSGRTAPVPRPTTPSKRTLPAQGYPRVKGPAIIPPIKVDPIRHQTD